MLKPQPPLPNLKTIRRGAPGQVIGKITVVRREKSGEETVLHEAVHDKQVPLGDLEGPLGISGVGFGLTIPGPEKSYMAARIDAFSYLPHGPSDEDARGAMKRSSALVQEQLEVEAREAQEFFASMKR